MSAELAPVEPLVEVAARAVEGARRAGAQAADAMVSRGTEFEVKVADGAILTLSQATAKRLGLRVFVDGAMGFCTTSDFGRDALLALGERAVAAARASAHDPDNGLLSLPPGRMDLPDALGLFDEAIVALSTDTKLAWAHAIEAAARAAEPQVTKFRDSGVGTTLLASALVTSDGVERTARRTGISAWSSPVAVRGAELQTEAWYDVQSRLEALETPESVGRTAARRAARMLGARPIATQALPVLFEPQMAMGLMGSVLGALDGDLVRKKASFLGERLGEQVASEGMTLVDDPMRPQALGSSPFDGEGMPTQRRALIDRGRLTGFLYDSRAARKAGIAPTGSAQRSAGSMPHAGVFNLILEPGAQGPEAMLRGLPRALILTRGLGQGLNTVSGEYSRGANGLLVERGEVVHPVQEVTIAGDCLTMLRGVAAVGSDLQLRGGSGAPSVLVGEMMVSGAG